VEGKIDAPIWNGEDRLHQENEKESLCASLLSCEPMFRSRLASYGIYSRSHFLPVLAGPSLLLMSQGSETGLKIVAQLIVRLSMRIGISGRAKESSDITGEGLNRPVTETRPIIAWEGFTGVRKGLA
jgi:hypothetical protein